MYSGVESFRNNKELTEVSPPSSLSASPPMPKTRAQLERDKPHLNDLLSTLPDGVLSLVGKFLPSLGFCLRPLCRSLSTSPAFGTVTTRYGTREWGDGGGVWPGPVVGATAAEAVANLKEATGRRFEDLEEHELEMLWDCLRGRWDEKTWGERESEGLEHYVGEMKRGMLADLDAVLAEVQERGEGAPDALNSVLAQYRPDYGLKAKVKRMFKGKAKGRDKSESDLHWILQSWWEGEEEWLTGDNFQQKRFVQMSSRDHHFVTVYRFNLRPVLTVVSRDKSVSVTAQLCDRCGLSKTGVTIFSCAYKYCNAAEGHFCPACISLLTCSSCGKSGCPCRFDTCAFEGCGKHMCRVSNFGGWKMDDSGEAPGCSHVVYPPAGSDDEDEEANWEEVHEAERTRYCQEHAPKGSTPFRGMF